MFKLGQIVTANLITLRKANLVDVAKNKGLFGRCKILEFIYDGKSVHLQPLHGTHYPSFDCSVTYVKRVACDNSEVPSGE